MRCSGLGSGVLRGRGLGAPPSGNGLTVWDGVGVVPLVSLCWGWGEGGAGDPALDGGCLVL